MRTPPLLYRLAGLAAHLPLALASPYQARIHETGSYFTAPADYGAWLMAYYVNGNSASHADLVSIQTSDTSTGTVQVRAARYTYGSLSSARESTAFPANANFGVWTLADYDGDGALDLVYIQNRDTVSGRVEVSVASGASAFQTLVLDKAQTAFDVAINGHWQTIDVDGDGTLDLVYIQNSNTESNKVEVHVASGASSFSTVAKKIETIFDIGNDGSWQMVNYDNDGVADLAYVQDINTSSGYVEVNIASGASNYQTVVQSAVSAYSTENKGVWQLIDWDNDGVLDMVYIKTQDTAGTVESIQQWLLDFPAAHNSNSRDREIPPPVLQVIKAPAAAGATGQSRSGPTIFYAHGGGYHNPIQAEGHVPFVILCATACKARQVVFLEYSLAPEEPYPCQLIQAAASLRFIIEEDGVHVKDIVLGGDSAAGI
ncbi:hypothetical protein BJY01DRAFT_247486 [Aspergillus pseudoustus]|uniref:Alpha/beta hydrolase fold-3 domain-containing protein n=1 Tax=Aspergillus pseudoustus TaxID=1810923 RepID=A0ABR4K250_9EURO